MKQYKLIKTYPNSPELGTIVTYYGNWNMYGITNECIFKVDVIENSPEFWEKVVQKEYEILKIKIKTCGTIVTYNNEGKAIHRTDGCSIKFTLNLNKALESQNTEIYSVKRVCDGEVFTIGDKCNPISSSYKENIHPITKFELIMNNTKLRVNSLNWYLDIKSIEKSKQPLFTTEDGVDIHTNQYTYGVHLPTMKFTGDYIWRYKDNFSSISLSKETKYFSTEEKAKEYIIMNKPCLSINEINFLKTEGFCFWDSKLKELVKSKI